MGTRKKLEGTTINNLFVKEYLGDNQYLCICTLCGGTRECRSYELSIGKYKACKKCEALEHGKNGKANDYTGKTIGNWQMLHRDETNGKKWICKCLKCGREFSVYTQNILHGKSNCCSECASNAKQDNSILNKKFKYGKVIKRLDKNMWECTCGYCGRTIKRNGTILKNNESILCNYCHNDDSLIDITGTTIGDWEVLYKLKTVNTKHVKYRCRCKLCGREEDVFGYNLRHGRTLSCGCKNFIDMTGQKINEWTVIKYLGMGFWGCQCSCGEPRVIHGYELRTRAAESCGCKKWEYTRDTLLANYNEVAPLDIGNPRTLKKVHEYNLDDCVDINSRHSKQESEILDILYSLLDKDDIIIGDRKALSGKELDIYIPKLKLAIEVNGIYCHSTLFKPKRYHQEKTIACSKVGIRLIHIFEYEWENQKTREQLTSLITNLIDSSNNYVIGARNTTVSCIEYEDYSTFLDMYHLQGSAKAAIKIGIFEGKDLLGVAGFGKPRFNQEFEYELIRLCWKPGVAISGGLSKIMKYFVDKYSPKSIVSYCDISKFYGNGYTKVGFKSIEITAPNYVWCSQHNNNFVILSRYQTQKSKLVELGLGTADQTEDEIMMQNGYLKIYDSGNLRLEWRANWEDMPAIRDLSNQRFGNLVAIQYVGSSEWLCRCDCGNTEVINSRKLVNGIRTDCKKCANKRRTKNTFNDLTGQVIGGVTVLEYLGNQKYSVKCNKCNKVYTITASAIKNGIKECKDCANKSQSSPDIDLTGQIIGELTVNKYLGGSLWECKCSCGEIIKVKTFNLTEAIRLGKSKSCAKCSKNGIKSESITIGDPEYYSESETVRISESQAIENSIANYISSIYNGNIIHMDRSVLANQELDIYLPDLKLAIEVNGDYWHSTLEKKYNYHQLKTINCAKRGIRLIHIFEYEWNDSSTQQKIKDILSLAIGVNLCRIGARDTEVKVISNSEAIQFCNQHHLQNGVNANISLGCFYNSELIGVMTFSSPRFDHNYQYELMRLCWKNNTIVIGGSQKLFNYFIKNYTPESILTYTDITKFTGNGYLKLGFKLIQKNTMTRPNYHWIKNNKVLPRYKTQKSKLVELGLGTADQTEDEIMAQNGYLKIYDSGNLRLEWRA